MDMQLEFDFGQDYKKKELVPKKREHNDMQKIVKVFDKELPNADIIRFGNNFVDEFFLGNGATKLTINTIKIIFNIISQLRNEQFQSKSNPEQLSLFENEFSTHFNSYAQIKIKNSLITRDTNSLKKAYELLENYKKGWYKVITSDGREIQSYGGIVSNIFYETKGYTTFLISNYWVKKLILIENYNKTLYNLVYNVRSNKHILFYFWLLRLPEEGTKVKLDTLNNYFNLEYSTAKELCSSFLKPIKDNLNKYSHKSFNYSYLANTIKILPFATKNIDDKAIAKEETKKEIERDYKIKYIKERHQLTNKQIEPLNYICKKDKTAFNIVQKAYQSFVSLNKGKTTSFIGEEFLITFQKNINEEYQKNSIAKYLPKCYIKIL